MDELSDGGASMSQLRLSLTPDGTKQKGGDAAAPPPHIPPEGGMMTSGAFSSISFFNRVRWGGRCNGTLEPFWGHNCVRAQGPHALFHLRHRYGVSCGGMSDLSHTLPHVRTVVRF